MNNPEIMSAKRNYKLIQARESLNLRPSQVAKESGVSHGNYLDYEENRSFPLTENQRKICDFYRSRGVFLFEEDVFPIEFERLHNTRRFQVRTRKNIPEEKLIPLSLIQENELPYIDYMGLKSIDYSELRERVNAVLLSLTPLEREVVMGRYLYEGGTPVTLKKIGDITGHSKGHIYDVEMRALRKLRKPSKIKALSEFCDFKV